MKKTCIIALSILLLLILPLTVYAHSGGTDSQGGHRSPDGYHFHHGKPAHQHINGVCTYDIFTYVMLGLFVVGVLGLLAYAYVRDFIEKRKEKKHNNNANGGFDPSEWSQMAKDMLKKRKAEAKAQKKQERIKEMVEARAKADSENSARKQETSSSTALIAVVAMIVIGIVFYNIGYKNGEAAASQNVQHSNLDFAVGKYELIGGFNSDRISIPIEELDESFHNLSLEFYDNGTFAIAGSLVSGNGTWSIETPVPIAQATMVLSNGEQLVGTFNGPSFLVDIMGQDLVFLRE